MGESIFFVIVVLGLTFGALYFDWRNNQAATKKAGEK